MVPVKGLMRLKSDHATSIAALNISFAAAGQLAFVLHLICAEIYLALTPREAERLRKVSYQRQREKGFKNPGSAGLVAQRIGDAEPWTPEEKTVDEGLKGGWSRDQDRTFHSTKIASYPTKPVPCPVSSEKPDLMSRPIEKVPFHVPSHLISQNKI